MTKIRFSFSLIALIGANLVPLIGALFFAWDENLVLALYWIENLIIGAFNLLKMIIVAVRNGLGKGLFRCVFFVLHYGLFCLVHGKILWELLDLGEMQNIGFFEQSSFVLFDLLSEGVSVFMGFIDLFEPIIWMGVLALVLSHLVSFIEHFILRGEMFKLDLSTLMGRPYGQIVVMHVGLIAGAIALQKFGSPIWLLAVIVALKIFIDCAQHSRRHREKQNVNTSATSL